MQLESANPAQPEYGTLQAQIREITILGEQSGASVVSSGEVTCITVDYEIHAPIEDLTVGILLRDRFGQDVFGTNSHLHGMTLPCEQGKWQVRFTMAMDIAPGKYTVTAALHTQENHTEQCYHWMDGAANFEVAGILGDLFSGLCRLRPRIEAGAPAATP
jgi:lipopolysaccharide transport system ATP-binding protein